MRRDKFEDYIRKIMVLNGTHKSEEPINLLYEFTMSKNIRARFYLLIKTGVHTMG